MTRPTALVAGAAATASPAQALRLLRGDRHRALRQTHSLGDQVYPYYVGLLFAVYAGFGLDGVPDATVHGQRISATAGAHAAIPATGALFVLLAVLALLWSSSNAVDGGPVVLSPQECAVLLTVPIPRSLLVRRALGLAWSRAVAVGLGLGVIALFVEVGLLARTAAETAAPCLLLPPLVAVTGVSLGWLVESTPCLLRPVRTTTVVVLAAILAIVVYCVHAARKGPVAFWDSLHRLGSAPGPWRLGVWAVGPQGSATERVVGIAIVGAVALGSVLLALLRSDRMTAEELRSRSGRAMALRAAIYFADTSSLYLGRTRRARMRHRRRYAPGLPGVRGALVTKAGLQQQGVSPLPRILAAAVMTGWLVTLGLGIHGGSLSKPDQIGVLAIAVVVAAVGTRFVDPLRLDLDRPDAIARIPVALNTIVVADIAAPWVDFMVGVVLAAIVAPALGVLPVADVGLLLVAGALLGLVTVTSGAAGVVPPDRWGLISPNLQLGLKLVGVVPAVLALELAAGGLHDGQSGRVVALLALAVIGVVTVLAVAAAGARRLRI